MKALVVQPGPRFSVQDVYNGWAEALVELLGDDNVETFDLDNHLTVFGMMTKVVDGEPVGKVFDKGAAAAMAAKHLEAVLYEFWPDVIFIVSGFYIPEPVYRVARARGKRIVLIHTESPYEDDIQLIRAQFADLNVINDPTNLDDFLDVAPTLYVPHAYRPGVHRPGPPVPELKSDVAFVGTGYQSRIRFLEAVDWTGIDLLLAGHWHELDEASPLAGHLVEDSGRKCMHNVSDDGPLSTLNVYRSTKASLNLYRVEDMKDNQAVGWAMGPREVELAACGTWFARQPRPEGDELLPMLPTFTDPAELGEILRWAITHDDEREAAAAAARAAIAERTFTAHAAQVLQHLS